MGAVVDRIKAVIAWATALFADLRRRWHWLDHLLAMQERYSHRRGNLYAASISFNGILALVPIIMVAFAIAAFVLARQPEVIDQIKDAVVKELPGAMGTQVEQVIDSAIDSRTTVGVVGLAGAALTGIGWISGVRNGMTEMFGGRKNRNAVVSKGTDLLTFALLGIAFAVTMALTTLGNQGSLLRKILEWAGADEASWAPSVLRFAAIIVSITASWLLFSFILSRLPLVPLPFVNTMRAGLVTAIAFEIVKNLGGIYLRSVLGSPAGVAFGPILGVMVFAYLASRIILYATAWCATDPINAPYQVVDEVDEGPGAPVTIRPVVEVNPTSRVGVLAGAAALGAVAGALVDRFRRR
ncbi:inner membrane protein YhjD [Gordonia desulfuricans]|uniref:Inner membrane protein YhjD n=1 Tax=Gordonia desulfuricans TaxID=89051 RepID=A0A7K3LPB3_9ACTN|nr:MULTISPECIES: YhjD/YihY/BrkB family envelope integrity protein [Gordonia]KOY49420.1 ribonuclease BN [Gordonia sp. NB41Y]NDK89891.1 inner membrane protein YhjD [Gordonia desulfuricans]WLP91552.1 YhjD/YihY/BrkB family envelope integrity protein [Gordonia sp. NB41Y]